MGANKGKDKWVPNTSTEVEVESDADELTVNATMLLPGNQKNFNSGIPMVSTPVPISSVPATFTGATFPLSQPFPLSQVGPGGQSSFGQPSLGQPLTQGQPSFGLGQSSFGQPLGQQSSGQSSFGQPVGQPSLGQPLPVGQPSFGLGQSPFGQLFESSPGQPAFGLPGFQNQLIGNTSLPVSLSVEEPVAQNPLSLDPMSDSSNELGNHIEDLGKGFFGAAITSNEKTGDGEGENDDGGGDGEGEVEDDDYQGDFEARDDSEISPDESRVTSSGEKPKYIEAEVSKDFASLSVQGVAIQSNEAVKNAFPLSQSSMSQGLNQQPSQQNISGFGSSSTINILGTSASGESDSNGLGSNGFDGRTFGASTSNTSNEFGSNEFGASTFGASTFGMSNTSNGLGSNLGGTFGESNTSQKFPVDSNNFSAAVEVPSGEKIASMTIPLTATDTNIPIVTGLSFGDLSSSTRDNSQPVQRLKSSISTSYSSILSSSSTASQTPWRVIFQRLKAFFNVKVLQFV